MSAYRNFIQDYPARCRRLLTKYYEDAENNDLEVSLLLNIASSGLIVPYARLSDGAHPSGDAARFTKAKQTFDAALTACVCKSDLFTGAEPSSWRIGKSRELRGDPDAWNLDALKPVTPKKTVTPLVKILRNALAHGNVFSRGRPHITSLVFLSRLCHEKPELGYEILVVSPHDLKEFVLAWLSLLANIDIPGQTFIESNLFVKTMC